MMSNLKKLMSFKISLYKPPGLLPRPAQCLNVHYFNPDVVGLVILLIGYKKKKNDSGENTWAKDSKRKHRQKNVIQGCYKGPHSAD